jgi:hypothetical protein
MIVWIVIVLLITAVAVLVWRAQVPRRDDKPLRTDYRRQLHNLRGGGIHPGAQPSKPPRPNNSSGGGGAY